MGNESGDGVPLFRTAAGVAPSKEAMVESFEAVARALGLPTRRADGLLLYSGHTLRLSGAQFLARNGVDLWRIQLLGRWGCDRVLQYVQEAPLSSLARMAPRMAKRTELEDLLDLRGADGFTDPKASWLEKMAARLRPTAAETAALSAAKGALHEGASGEPDPLPYILNTESKVYHLVVFGDSRFPPAKRVSACGRSFGCTLKAVRRAALPRGELVDVCGSCLRR